MHVAFSYNCHKHGLQNKIMLFMAIRVIYSWSCVLKSIPTASQPTSPALLKVWNKRQRSCNYCYCSTAVVLFGRDSWWSLALDRGEGPIALQWFNHPWPHQNVTWLSQQERKKQHCYEFQTPKHTFTAVAEQHTIGNALAVTWVLVNAVSRRTVLILVLLREGRWVKEDTRVH
jgi:hypothetical protein